MEDDSERFGFFSDAKQIYSVLDSINKQREDSKLCDVTLKIADDQIFAHSNVLAAASPYFDALFSGQDLPRMFSQKSPQIIEIHIDGPKDPAYVVAVQKVVDFMYTSQIRLDFAILTQVQEIAKIMQMEIVIDFCDLFQQGYSTYTSSGTVEAGRQPCRDVQIQTNIETDKRKRRQDGKNDFEVFVFNKKGEESIGTDETWTFSKNFKQNYKQIRPAGAGRIPKKRGRPRKINVIASTEESVQTETESTKTNSEEKENLDKGDGKEDAEGKENTEEKQNGEATIDVHARVKKDENVKLGCTEQQYKVSRRGRVIKPKVFPDDLISIIKQEVLSDVESDDNTQDQDFAANEEERSNTDEVSDERPAYLSLDGQENVKVEISVGLYTCEKCDFKCTKLCDYNSHQREHMHKEKMCSYCGWICDSSTVSDKEFEEHVKNHSGAEPFFCNFCCARFKTRTKLFLHLPKHSKNKPFVCDICHAGFKWKHALKNHMITHKKTKDYLCDICGFSTAHKTQLKAHHLIHTGDTFKCSEPGCEYQATKKSNLKFHMMTHTREKPHQCEVCGTSFSLVKNMKRHMLLHTTDRPFRCGMCSFSTTRFDKLKEHGFKQHNVGEKPAKKFRLSEYIKMQEGMEIPDLEEDIIKNDALNIPVGENMETIELQVAEEENGAATTQIVNVTSSTGEAIPIAITQLGNDISYEIQQFPIQFVTQEIVTDG